MLPYPITPVQLHKRPFSVQRVILCHAKIGKPQGGFYWVGGMGATGNFQYIVYLFTPKVNIQFRF